MNSTNIVDVQHLLDKHSIRDDTVSAESDEQKSILIHLTRLNLSALEARIEKVQSKRGHQVTILQCTLGDHRLLIHSHLHSHITSSSYKQSVSDEDVVDF